jgi:hypothetical protein
MRYTEPKIIRTENAVSLIQHVGDVNDSTKPLEDILDNNQTKQTSPSAYEADE